MRVRSTACRLEHAPAATGLVARRLAACAGAYSTPSRSWVKNTIAAPIVVPAERPAASCPPWLAGVCWCRRGRELQCGAAQAAANLVNGRDEGLDLSHMTLENR